MLADDARPRPLIVPTARVASEKKRLESLPNGEFVRLQRLERIQRLCQPFG
jgi:hypothetical protein